ncbi:MAG: glycosyltransferase family 2 protein [Nitrosomonas sp.]|uniref:glycosyltransferase family 2 protein n=1 Tax=Nitrosomonas sp. TaxID=42353 RepID=UPI001DF8BE83|nr:glycosyltransferase family 2 protein [Nitrosomonas sp.]MBX9895513.1 glycosyltransferase family 2 protein [Nitrosomonas sp.]
MKSPFFSIVIVNYNAGDMLFKVMSALAQQTYKNFEVIVVDNNSQDNSWRATENLPFPCRLVRLNNNIGFAAANNLAVKNHVKGEWLFLLNPDAYPEPECLAAVEKNINQISRVDCFSCVLIDANQPSQLDGLGDDYHISGLHWRHGHGAPSGIIPKYPVEVFSACAAAAIYRTKTFRRLDGFDETYFAYSEDVDLGFRLRLAGGKSVLLPDAKVRHVGSAITGRSSDFSIYHGHRNLTWTFIKNVPGPLIPFLLPVHLVMVLYMGLFFAASGRFSLYMRAKTDAFKQIRSQLVRRKEIQHQRVCSSLDLLRMMSWLPRGFCAKVQTKKCIKSR